MTHIYEHPLATHANQEMCELWSDEYLVGLERKIWYRVCQFHMTRGVIEPDRDTLDRLHASFDQVDLESIANRERRTRHDLMARLEETVAVAGIPEVIHLGMTSADVVENTYLIRMARTCSQLARYDRFADLEDWDTWLPFRGIKGPVGTQQDQLDLLGTAEECERLDESVAGYFGFRKIARSVGQVMWRSTDLMWASYLLRYITDEPWRTLAHGYMMMVAGYAGDTWNEGDVASSSVRRIAIPGLALTAAAQARTPK